MSFNIIEFIKNFVSPIGDNEDTRKREFILNVLLSLTIVLSFVSFAINFIDWLHNLGSAIPVGIVFLIFSFFVFLYWLSRKGKINLSAFLLLATFFLAVTYMQYSYGVDLPTGMLTYALIIIMSGILINARFALWATLVIGGTMLVVGHLQNSGAIKMDGYWRQETWKDTDTIVITIIFAIMATISWLSNREIDKSLLRARKSEAELKIERDSLEITVEKRTKELKETQAEKMDQLYRFAEFGRLSSGLFHDLINPLNAVSLNMEKLKNQTNEGQIQDAAGYVDKAIYTAKKLEDLVTAVRKQLARQENKSVFSLNKEIEYVLDVLSHKALKAKVTVHFESQSEIKMFGDAIKFNQAVLNLVANAIDSYQGENKGKGARKVEVSLNEKADKIILIIKDNGSGIAKENVAKIFEPFFTTKPEETGLGLGLSMTKRIVEKDFEGTIRVESKIGSGTVFTIELPHENKQ